MSSIPLNSSSKNTSPPTAPTKARPPRNNARTNKEYGYVTVRAYTLHGRVSTIVVPYEDWQVLLRYAYCDVSTVNAAIRAVSKALADLCAAGKLSAAGPKRQHSHLVRTRAREYLCARYMPSLDTHRQQAAAHAAAAALEYGPDISGLDAAADAAN